MATKRVVTPDNLSNSYFDIGENTSNQIEYKFAFSISRLKTSTNLPPVVFITDNTKEGLFEYDNTDTTTVGDDIDVIVTNAGRRYKRKTSTTTEVLNKLDKGYTIAQLRTLSDSKVNTIGLFYCIDNGKEGWWKYDSTDTSSTDNLGTVLVTSTGKRLKRIIQDYIYPEWFGAKGDGVQDDTFFLQAFFIHPFKYKKLENIYKVSSKLDINSNDVVILDGKILKNDINTSNSTDSYIISLGSNSKLLGNGFIDGNSSALSSGRINTFAINYGIVINGNNIYIDGITIQNTFNETIYGISKSNIYISNLTEYNIGHGATFKFCENVVYNDYKQLNSNFQYTSIYQHCLDFWYCNGVKLNNILIKDVTASVNAPSYAISGISIFGCSDGIYNNIKFVNNNSSLLIGLPIADDGSINSLFSNILIENWNCGAGIEVQGGRNNKYSNIIIDNTDISNTISGNVGLHILDTGIMGGLLNENTSTQQSRDRAISFGNTFENIKIIGGYTGFRISGKENTFINCQTIGQSFGWRLQQLQGGVETNYWNNPIDMNISGNRYINCSAKNCLVDGVGYWGGEHTFYNFVSLNNKNGFENQKRLTTTISNVVDNSNITLVSSLTVNQYKNFYIYITTGNSFGSYKKIISNTTDTITLESALSVLPSNGDELVIVDKQGELKLFGGEFNDNQNFIIPGGGSTNYTGSISNITSIDVVFNNENIDYNQKIKLKNVVTGSSNPDLICRVGSLDKSTTDKINITPISLGDGSNLSGTFSPSLTSGVGTVSTFDYNVNSVTNTILTRVDGVTATLSTQIDGHYWIVINGEYLQVLKKLDVNSYLLTSKISSNVTNSSFSIVKFDIEGIPSSETALYFNRHYGKVMTDNSIIYNNLSVGILNNFRSWETIIGNATITSSVLMLNNFNLYKTNNVSATTINSISTTANLNRKIYLYINDINTTIGFSTGNIRGYVNNKTLSVGDIVEFTYNGTYWIAVINNVAGTALKQVFGDFLSTSVGLSVRGGISGNALMDFERTQGVSQKYSITLPSGFALMDNTNSNNVSFFTSAAGTNNIIIIGQNRTTTTPRVGEISSESVLAGSGTNIAGASLQISSGRGTGTGTPSEILFYTPDSGASGTSQQNRSVKGKISSSANWILQNGGTFTDSGDRLQVTGTSLFTDKIKFSTGSNKPVGSFTLIAGTVTVTNSIVTTNSKIFVTRNLNGGTIGNITITPANGSFTVTSSSNTETSTFDYLIIN